MRPLNEKNGGDGIIPPDALLRAFRATPFGWRGTQALRNGLNRRGRSSSLTHFLELKNATLIGRGMSYADRKKIIEATALDLRVVPFPMLPTTEDRAA